MPLATLRQKIHLYPWRVWHSDYYTPSRFFNISWETQWFQDNPFMEFVDFYDDARRSRCYAFRNRVDAVRFKLLIASHEESG